MLDKTFNDYMQTLINFNGHGMQVRSFSDSLSDNELGFKYTFLSTYRGEWIDSYATMK